MGQGRSRYIPQIRSRGPGFATRYATDLNIRLVLPRDETRRNEAEPIGGPTHSRRLDLGISRWKFLGLPDGHEKQRNKVEHIRHCCVQSVVALVTAIPSEVRHIWDCQPNKSGETRLDINLGQRGGRARLSGMCNRMRDTGTRTASHLPDILRAQRVLGLGGDK